MVQADHNSTLRYRLAPSDEAKQALEETFEAYEIMFSVLEELAGEKGGANLVTLHEIAYETIRERTGLPARLVTLGLRDFASSRGNPAWPQRLPLDDKLFAIKGPSDLTVATVRGRVAIPYDVAGYSSGALNIFAAELVSEHGIYEIRISVKTHSDRTEDNMMMNEGILSRMGRLIAGAANAAVDRIEDTNKVAVVEQALREIDAAADEARADIGKSKAEEYRINTRREEIMESLRTLDEKIRLALDTGREDLAKAGVARQIDLEAQIAALDKALTDARAHLEEGQQALQAVLATRREAEARLSDLKRSLSKHPEDPASGRRSNAGAGAARAAAAVSRVTGVASDRNAASAELDELDRLHREQAIEARLARFKSGLSH
jgi:phage shock protein A